MISKQGRRRRGNDPSNVKTIVIDTRINGSESFFMLKITASCTWPEDYQMIATQRGSERYIRKSTIPVTR